MRISTIIASVLGIGYFPIASGTVMSIVAVPLAIFIARHGGGGPGVVIASLLALPIILLYEISIWCVWIIERRRLKEEAGTDVAVI